MERVIYQIIASPAGTGWAAHCPELDITAFGDTSDLAQTALRRQVSDYLDDCAQLDLLETTLTEAGFYHNGEAWMSSRIEPPQPTIRFIGSPFPSAPPPQK